MRATLLIFLLPLFCFAQNVITDDFSDGDFSQNPAWIGDTAKFTVNPAFELQLDDNAAGEAYLSTVSEIIENATWEFYLRMEFNPSTSNFAKVYLVSDRADLSGNLNGYFVRLGGSSSDRISLYRQDGNTSSLILESTDDWLDLNLVEVRVKVTRDSTGFWVLSADTASSSTYTPIDSALDAVHSSSAHFGISCEYTSTRSDKFFFDDFSLSGDMFVDDQAAQVTMIEVIDSTELLLTFSEVIDSTSATDIANYQGSATLGLPSSATLDSTDHSKVSLQFSSAFPVNENLELYVLGIEDLAGNLTDDTLSFVRYVPQEGQVIITELMPDPSPVIGTPPNALPEREYIEIYNNSDISINLKNWVLEIGSAKEILPAYELASGDYLVITKDEGVPEFPQNLPVLGLDMSSTALTNGGNSLALFAADATLINQVSYTDGWYYDPNKSNGGWSLEMVDINSFCGGAENWRASIDPVGGTPGKVNSVAGVNPDTIAPYLERIAIRGDSSLALYFSERVDELATQPSNYSINPPLQMDSLYFETNERNVVFIQLNEMLQENIIYTISLLDFPKDCSGNTTKNDTLIFGIPSTPEAGEVLINELLFNPYPDETDFVELYNHSDKIFDLSKLYLGNWNATMQAVENAEPVLSESFLFVPNSYVALTTESTGLNSYFIKQPETIVEVENLPTMSDSEGSLAVVTSNLAVVCDYFEYTDKMHSPLLEDDEGVSLERVNFSTSAQNPDNWKSAASTAGFATPGYENSMAYSPISKGTVTVDPKVFSPNQDGYHDVVNINYSFAQAGNIVSLNIWNSSGQPIRQLQQNTSVGQKGFFSWDGTDEYGQRLNSGIYIVVLEYFNTSGDTEIFKETCVLSL